MGFSCYMMLYYALCANVGLSVTLIQCNGRDSQDNGSEENISTTQTIMEHETVKTLRVGTIFILNLKMHNV